MQWRPFSAVVTAVLAILVGLFFQIKHDSELASARAETQLARRDAAVALAITGAALDYADSVTHVADSIEAHAKAQAAQAAIAAAWAKHTAAQADSAAAAAPDTCAPALALMAAARDAEHVAAESWHDAYLDEVEAAAKLRQAGDTLANTTRDLSAATETLSDAAGSLVKASRPSFLAQLKPRINIDAVTFDPRTAKIEAGPKVGLGWSIAL